MWDSDLETRNYAAFEAHNHIRHRPISQTRDRQTRTALHPAGANLEMVLKQIWKSFKANLEKLSEQRPLLCFGHKKSLVPHTGSDFSSRITTAVGAGATDLLATLVVVLIGSFFK